MYKMGLSEVDKLSITNRVLSRLLTASHEVEKCASHAAGLKEVKNRGHSFVLNSLDKFREACHANLR